MKQRYLWLLDHGHAPDKVGKRSPVMEDGTQLLEWEFARDVVRRLAELLAARGIAHHILTPATNADLPPSARARLANLIAARYASGLECRLVSAHANAHGYGEWTSARGVATLHHEGSLGSRSMARVFQKSLVLFTEWPDRGLKPRDDLSILKRTNMPAILTESGFYTNREEAAALLTGATRQLIATAHAVAIQTIESGEES